MALLFVCQSRSALRTFLGGLVLAVLVGTGPPGAPRRHLTLDRTADVAKLGGDGRRLQTEVTGHRPQGCTTTDTSEELRSPCLTASTNRSSLLL